MTKPSLLDLALDELIDALSELDEPAFRATQIWQAVFKNLHTSYDEITTLPRALRGRLQEAIPWYSATILEALSSSDRRTTKLLLELHDGETVETVIMRYARRNTTCVSTQAGCAMGCTFCATGQSGFKRDLTAGEIVDQIVASARLLHSESRHLSNVVFMGMGEPLANDDATFRAIRILNDPRGFSMGARSFTISTVGIIPGIKRLAQENLQVNLAVSLHTADETLRSQLIPMNHLYPVAQIVRACREYTRATHRRVTFEIALIAGVNDSDAHAMQVADALHGVLCHINVIPFNPIAGSPWQPSSNERVNAYAHMIESIGYPVSIRHSRGADIQAACGQLRADSNKEQTSC